MTDSFKYPFKHPFESNLFSHKTYFKSRELWIVFRTKITLSLNDTFDIIGIFDTKEDAHANAKLGDLIKGPVTYFREQR